MHKGTGEGWPQTDSLQDAENLRILDCFLLVRLSFPNTPVSLVEAAVPFAVIFIKMPMLSFPGCSLFRIKSDKLAL